MVAPPIPRPRIADRAEAPRLGHFKAFLARVDAHERAGDWRSPFMRSLNIAMRDHGISSSELADMSGDRRDQISAWINGKAIPHVRNAARLERAPGIDSP